MFDWIDSNADFQNNTLIIQNLYYFNSKFHLNMDLDAWHFILNQNMQNFERMVKTKSGDIAVSYTSSQVWVT